MTKDPITVPTTTTEVAQRMREHTTGDALVLDGERLCGVVPDRDIVTRAVADELPGQAVVGEVCSKDPVTVRVDQERDAQHDRVDEDRRHCSCRWTRFGCLPPGNVHRVAVW
jgi:CBS domain-containing protein